MKFNKVYFYPISVFLGFLLYFLLFNLNIVNPDYSFGNPQLCVELVEYQLKPLTLLSLIHLVVTKIFIIRDLKISQKFLRKPTTIKLDHFIY